MNYSRNTRLEDELLTAINDELYGEPDTTRVQPSVTGMIYCLSKTYYENHMVMPDSQGRKIPTRNRQTILLFITGLGLEKVLLNTRQSAESGIFEGISYHTDHSNIAGEFIEVKSTRARINKNPNEPYMSEGWKKQLLAYYKVKGITSGNLCILHLFGSGNPPFPELHVWTIEASQGEIDENWNWLKYRAEVYNSFVERKEAPTQYKYNMDWECRDCSWAGLCQARNVIDGVQGSSNT